MGARPKVVIHTDGACSGNPGPGGWGAILEAGHHRKKLKGGEPLTTNNRMELSAAIEARVAGEYGAAWDLISAIGSTGAREKERATLLHVTGDLGGALRASELGLAAQPGDLELTWRAASIALTLGDAGRARRHVDGLESALEKAELSAKDRGAWGDVAESFRLGRNWSPDRLSRNSGVTEHTE